MQRNYRPRCTALGAVLVFALFAYPAKSDAANVIGVHKNGDLYSYDISPSDGTITGGYNVIGNATNVRLVADAGARRLFYVKNDGYLYVQYYDMDALHPRLGKLQKVGPGWSQAKSIMTDGKGKLFRVKKDGAMELHTYSDSSSHTTFEYQGQIGTGWQNFSSVFRGPSSSIWAVDRGLIWEYPYRQSGSSIKWKKRREIRKGFTFNYMTNGPRQSIVARASNADLFWYENALASKKKIGAGWRYFISLAVIETSDEVASPANTKRDAIVRRCLGHGYDASGEYADERELRSTIFDLTSVGGYKLIPVTPQSRIEVISGSNAREFCNNLSVGVQGGYEAGLFSASIAASVKTSKSGSNKSSFALLDDTLYLFRARLTQQARPTQEALRDLNTMPVGSVIEKYGTHYTSLLDFGGHLSWKTYLEEEERKKAASFDLEVKAAYAGASGQGNVGGGTEELTKVMSARQDFFVSGGNAALNQRTQLDAQRYTDWKKSIRSTPGMAGFGTARENGLKPIWEVAGIKPQRVAILKMAIEQYIKDNAKPVFGKKAQPGVPIVYRNNGFKLKGESGEWLSTDYNWDSDGYYVRVKSKKNAGTHAFRPNPKEQVVSGEVVRIINTSTPSDSGYEEYRYISVGDVHQLFYYPVSKRYWREWKIWKNAIGQHKGEPIRHGDKIVIESLRNPGQVMQPSRSAPERLTTATDNYTWTIMLP